MQAAYASGMPVAFAAAVGLAVLAAATGARLDTSAATVAACAAILVTGLPHGTFDLALIQRRAAPGRVGRVAILAIYLCGAAAMLMLWRVAPVSALSLFMAISVAHFAEDWAGAGRLPSLAVAAAVLAAPAVLHTDEIRAIFAALAGEAEAGGVADVLRAAAPIAVAMALAAIALLVRRGRPGDAAGAAAAVMSTLLLPPAVGFALYFCLFHSPRHFGAARAILGWRWREWMPVVLPLTAAAIAIVGALFVGLSVAEPSLRLLSATFMALSILTVPHMATPAIVRWIEARTGKRPVRAETIRSR